METAQLIGWFATAASTVSFAPQAWQVIKTRETKDISLGMYIVTVTGFALWTTYGALLHEWPLIVTNAICLTLSGFILVMKVLPKPQKDEIADKIDPGR